MSVEIRTRLESLLEVLNGARAKYQIDNQDGDSLVSFDELINELEKFLVHSSGISSNPISKIYKEIRATKMSDSERRSLTNFLDLKNVGLDKFNRDVINQLNELNLDKFSGPLYFISHTRNNSTIDDLINQVRKIRLISKRFYENLEKELFDFRQNYIETNLKINNDFQYFVNDRKKEIEISISAFENSVKSISSKYNIASDDLDKIHETVLVLKTSIKTNNDDIQIIQKKLSEIHSLYKSEMLQLKNNLDLKVKEMEVKIYKDSGDKLLKYTEQVDEVNRLMMEDFDDIKNTTMKFSEFMRDETSNKLTNDFKLKAEGEMLAYYGFTALSFIIIFIAILISWNTLHTFAEAHIGEGKNYTDLDLIYLSIRLIFSLIVFLSVTYTSKLASKSYQHWKKNESIFLRLTALKSFIADMSADKKEEIHEKLVDVYFGKDEQDQTLNQKLQDLPNNITQLLGKVVEQTSVVFDTSKAKENAEKNK